MTDETVILPTCYARHAEMDGHMKEGRFWRGVIITAVISGIGVFIAQYNMTLDNNNKTLALTSKMTTMVDINTKRLDRIEDMYFKAKDANGSIVR